MSSLIRLNVNGYAYTGWKEISITKSMNNLCGGFSFSTSEKYPQNPYKWDLKMGDKCSVEIGSELLSVGYIEDIDISYDQTNHNIDLSGRDIICDLIDCTYNGSQREWVNQSLYQILNAICKDFEIELYIENSVISICKNEKVAGGKISATEGENALELISRLCKAKAVIPLCYGDGRLTITRAGTNTAATDPISLGYNVLDGTAQYSNRERFYSYVIKGQDNGGDLKDIESIAEAQNNNSISSIVKDDAITRKKRILTIINDQPSDINTCNKRAIWEKNTRAGNSRKYIYTLVDWLQSDYTLWQINSKVHLIDKQFDIKKEMLISAIDFSYSESQGQLTRLTLVDPMTYDVLKSNIKTEMDTEYEDLI